MTSLKCCATSHAKGGASKIKGALKSLLALVLLAGFCELLLPDDGMRKYARMVIGLIVLFSLINLVVQVGQVFSVELPVGTDGWGRADPESLVAEGLNLRQQGEEQATALTVSVVQTKVEQFLQKITGTGAKSSSVPQKGISKGRGWFCRRTRFQECKGCGGSLGDGADQVE